MCWWSDWLCSKQECFVVSKSIEASSTSDKAHIHAWTLCSLSTTRNLQKLTEECSVVASAVKCADLAICCSTDLILKLGKLHSWYGEKLDKQPKIFTAKWFLSLMIKRWLLISDYIITTIDSCPVLCFLSVMWSGNLTVWKQGLTPFIFSFLLIIWNKLDHH